MATLEEAKQQVARARQALQSRRSQLQRVSQRELRSGRGGGLEARQERRRKGEAIKELNVREQQLTKAEGEIKKFETEKAAFEKRQAEQQARVAEQNRKASIVNRYVQGQPLNRDEQIQLRKIFAEKEGLKDTVMEAKKRQDFAEIAPYISSVPIEKAEEFRKYGVKIETEEIAPQKIDPLISESLVVDGKQVYGPIQYNVPDAPDRTGQTYSPDDKLFVSSTYRVGAGGTATYTVPTMDEVKKFDDAAYKGSIAAGAEFAKEGAKAWLTLGKMGLGAYQEKVVVPISKSKAMEWYGEKVIPKVSKGLDWYGENVVQRVTDNVILPYEKYVGRPSRAAIGKGLGGYQEKVVKPLSEEGTVAGLKVMPPVKDNPWTRMTQDVIATKAYIDRLPPEKQIKMGIGKEATLEYAGKYQDMGLFKFGETVLYEQVEKGWTSFGKDIGATEKQAKYIGKGARYTTEFAPYLISDKVIIAKTGIKLGEAAFGGKFGGPTTVKQYVKENPWEIAIVGAIGASKTFKLFSGKTAKVRALKKYKPFTEQAEKTQVYLRSDLKGAGITDDVVRAKLRLSQVGKKGILESKIRPAPIVKGKAGVYAIKPTGSYSGKVVEKRLVESDTLWGRIWGTKVEKTFEGTAVLTKGGVLKQTITYTDDFGRTFTKVVTSPKKGKDVIQILKGGKEVLNIKTPKVAPVKYLFKDTKPTSYKIDQTTGLTGAERRTIKLGKKIKVVKDNFDGTFKGTVRKVEMGKVTGKVGTSPDKFSTVQYSQETYSLDLMSAKARKALAKGTTKKGSVLAKIERGQKLKYGIDKNLDDVAFYYRDKAGKLAFQKVSPQTQRAFIRGQQNEILIEYVKPTGKYGKEIAAKAQIDAMAATKELEKSRIAQENIEVLKKKLSSKEAKLAKIIKKGDAKEAKILKVLETKQQPVGRALTPTQATSDYAQGGLRYQETLTRQQYWDDAGRLYEDKIVGWATKQKLAGTVYFPKLVATGKVASPSLKYLTLELSKSPALGLDLTSKLGLLTAFIRQKKYAPQQKRDAEVVQEVVQEPEVKVDTKVTQLFSTTTTSDSKQDDGGRSDIKTDDPPLTRPPRTQPVRPPIGPPVFDIPEAPETKRKEKKIPVGAKPGYYAEVKDKGKWMRIAKKPRTKKEALALAGQVVDNSTAVQLRLIKARKKAIKETVKRRINRAKYRDYSIRAGKRKALADHGLIELKRHRIDTRGEKQQLSAAKLVRQGSIKSLRMAPRAKKSTRKQNFLFGGGFGGKSQRLI